jgi:hypothetical protein
LPHYPQIEAFCKSELPNKYPGLTIRYVRGAEPIVKLLDTSGDAAETLSIDKWDTDTITEFFNLRLATDTTSNDTTELDD